MPNNRERVDIPGLRCAAALVAAGAKDQVILVALQRELGLDRSAALTALLAVTGAEAEH